MLVNEITQNWLKIRVNSSVLGVPSGIPRNGSDERRKSSISREKCEEQESGRPPGEDRYMANVVLFAVSNQYLNGQTVTVSNGYVLTTGSEP